MQNIRNRLPIRSRFATMVGIAIIGMPAHAHDLWLTTSKDPAPPKFAERSTEPDGHAGSITVKTHIGHAHASEPWNIDPETVTITVTEVATAPDLPSSVDGARIPSGHGLQRRVELSHDSRDFEVQPSGHARCIADITLTTQPVYIELSPDDFENYLEDMGLDEARQSWSAAGRGVGREVYSRASRVLLPCGKPHGPLAVDDKFSPPLPLMFVPHGDAFDGHIKTKSWAWQLLADGKPVRNALVRISNVDHGISNIRTLRTDDDGSFEVRLPGGSWAFHTVVSHPMVVDHPDGVADYRTVFATVSFELT